MARKRRTKAEIARDLQLRLKERQEKRDHKMKIMRMEEEAKEMVDRHELQVGALCRYIRHISGGCAGCPFFISDNEPCITTTDSTIIEQAHEKMKRMEEGK